MITGPSDVGVLGALVAHRLRIPLVAFWQTNLHQYARSRAAAMVSFIPKAATTKLLEVVERLSFRATARFYKIPRLLFAPNQEIIRQLQKATGKPCFLMSHAVDTAVFSPEFRKRKGGPFQIGYVGRLTAEKNVRLLARLEQALLAGGHRDFRIFVVGQGREEKWLRNNLQQAEFRASSEAQSCRAHSPTWTSWLSRQRRIRLASPSLKPLLQGYLPSSLGGADRNIQCSMAAPDTSPTTSVSSLLLRRH